MENFLNFINFLSTDILLNYIILTIYYIGIFILVLPFCAIIPPFKFPILTIINTVIFITAIYKFNEFIEFAHKNNISNNIYLIICILFIIGLTLFIHRMLKYVFSIGFMQIFLFILFFIGMCFWFWAKIYIIGIIIFSYITFVIIQWFILSFVNKINNNWYFKIFLFPNIYYLTMNLFITDKNLKKLQKEHNYNEIYRISKEKIDIFLNNLKNGNYIIDTNVIILKK